MLHEFFIEVELHSCMILNSAFSLFILFYWPLVQIYAKVLLDIYWLKLS